MPHSINARSWPSLLVSLAAALVAQNTSRLILAAETETAPDLLQVEPREPGFGTIRYSTGGELVRTVSITNTSGKPLTIDVVEIGCGCMSVEWSSPVTLAPMQMHSFDVKLHQSQMRVGSVVYPLTFFGGSKPIASVPIRYTYQPRLDAAPRELHIFESGVADQRTSTATVQILDKTSPTGLRTECADDKLKVDLLPDHDDKRRYNLIVSARPDHRLGPVTSEIRVFADGSESPDLVVPVDGVIVPPVTATPQSVLLGALDKTSTHTRLVRLQSQAPFHVTKIETSTDEVNVVCDRAADKEQTFSVTISPKKPRRVFRENITFKLDAPIPFDVIVDLVGVLDDSQGRQQ